MFTVGMADITRIYFSCATLVIGVPTAVKIFAWSLALTEINFKDWSFVIVRTFISCFVFGGFTGLILANAALDLSFHDTYFVIGHFHYVLSIAAALGLILFILLTISCILFYSSTYLLILQIILLGIAGVKLFISYSAFNWNRRTMVELLSNIGILGIFSSLDIICVMNKWICCW